MPKYSEDLGRDKENSISRDNKIHFDHSSPYGWNINQHRCCDMDDCSFSSNQLRHFYGYDEERTE